MTVCFDDFCAVRHLIAVDLGRQAEYSLDCINTASHRCAVAPSRRPANKPPTKVRRAAFVGRLFVQRGAVNRVARHLRNASDLSLSSFPYLGEAVSRRHLVSPAPNKGDAGCCADLGIRRGRNTNLPCRWICSKWRCLPVRVQKTRQRQTPSVCCRRRQWRGMYVSSSVSPVSVAAFNAPLPTLSQRSLAHLTRLLASGLLCTYCRRTDCRPSRGIMEWNVRSDGCCQYSVTYLRHMTRSWLAYPAVI